MSVGAATPSSNPATLGDSRGQAARVALWGALAVLVGLIVIGGVTTQGFMTVTNVKAILSSVGIVGMVAAATAVIMISGNLFSLSVGSTTAACAMAFLALLPNGIAIAILGTILLGAVLGLVQGALVGGLGANPIIVTIGAASLIQGVVLWASDGATVVPPKGDTSYAWLNGRILTVPVTVYILFGGVAILAWLLRSSRFGRNLKLVGENIRAARAAGLPTVAVITGAFVLAGVLTAVAGIELGAFNESGSLLLEGNLTYDAIAAAVVGGIAITGGRGTVWQALGGAILIALISDLLLLRGYSEGVQILVKGVIVFLVVIIARLNRMGAS